MKSIVCQGGAKRERWAVSLCLASATLAGLQAANPDACAWMGLDAHQSFAFSAGIATLSVFMATFILTDLIARPEKNAS